MNSNPADRSAQLRWSVYLLLIAIAAGSMIGRILAVNAVDKAALEGHLVKRAAAERIKELEAAGQTVDDAQRKEIEREVLPKVRQQRPFLSANDRSRWAMVRALVEHGTFAIDDIVSQPGWDTIDMVKHRDREGVERLYSSKPPLLGVLMAGPYWVIHKLTGAALGTHPYEIGRFLVIMFNVVPLVIYFLLLGRMAERLGTTDWGRLFMFGAATFGTFLTTFAVVINNHLFAAVSAAIALYASLLIWYDGERRLRYFALAGFFAAFTAASELPALSFFAALSAALLWKAPKATLTGYVPAAAVVVIAFFATNYLAHDSLRPPYAHRSETDPSDNWYEYTFERGGQVRNSYWIDPSGIDRGEPSRGAYIFHSLIGHHGIFSLTPVWLLSVVGLAMWLRDRQRWELALFILAISAVCIVFYLMRPQDDRNYGGMTSGFRWVFWLAPMWLLALLPAADWLAKSRVWRGVGLVLLLLSVLSVSYPTWNPWTHPWITNFLLHLKWIEF